MNRKLIFLLFGVYCITFTQDDSLIKLGYGYGYSKCTSSSFPLTEPTLTASARSCPLCCQKGWGSNSYAVGLAAFKNRSALDQRLNEFTKEIADSKDCFDHVIALYQNKLSPHLLEETVFCRSYPKDTPTVSRLLKKDIAQLQAQVKALQLATNAQRQAYSTFYTHAEKEAALAQWLKTKQELKETIKALMELEIAYRLVQMQICTKEINEIEQLMKPPFCSLHSQTEIDEYWEKIDSVFE